MRILNRVIIYFSILSFPFLLSIVPTLSLLLTYESLTTLGETVCYPLYDEILKDTDLIIYALSLGSIISMSVLIAMHISLLKDK